MKHGQKFLFLKAVVNELPSMEKRRDSLALRSENNFSEVKEYCCAQFQMERDGLKEFEEEGHYKCT